MFLIIQGFRSCQYDGGMSETPDFNRDRDPQWGGGDPSDEPRYGVRRDDLPPGSYPPPVNQQGPTPDPHQSSYNAMSGWDSHPGPGWGEPQFGYDQNGWPVNNQWQQQPARRPGLMIAGCVLAWVFSAFGFLSSFGLLMASNFTPQELERIITEEMPPEFLESFYTGLDQIGGYEALLGFMRNTGIAILVFCALLSVAAIFIIAGSRAWRIIGVILAALASVVALFSIVSNPLVAVVWLACMAIIIVGWTMPATNAWLRQQAQLKRARR